MSAEGQATAVEFSPELRERIAQRRAMYEDPRAALLPVLHMVQAEHGCISPEVERAVAREMELPLAKVHEVLTFYTLFRSRPEGRCRVDICQTTSCMLRGARELFRHMREKHGIEPGETTADGCFTLHAVECLGNCECGPMAQIGDDYFGPLTPERLDEIRVIHRVSRLAAPDAAVTKALEELIELAKREVNAAQFQAQARQPMIAASRYWVDPGPPDPPDPTYLDRLKKALGL